MCLKPANVIMKDFVSCRHGFFANAMVPSTCNRAWQQQKQPITFCFIEWWLFYHQGDLNVGTTQHCMHSGQWRPLSSTCCSFDGNLPAVRLLLQYYPASSDIRDSHGRNFLHTAAMKGHCSIISHVMKNRMLDYLLNEQDKEGNKALHLAVLAGEYRVISKLLSSGKMQVHIMNNDGHTLSDLIENSTGFYLMVSKHSIFYLYILFIWM